MADKCLYSCGFLTFQAKIMSTKLKGFIFFSLFIIIIIIITVIQTHLDDGKAEKEHKERLVMVGHIEFKGKVINSKVYQFGGKNYYMICVKLDYSSVKEYYVLNNLCAIKIKNNIATIAAGFLSSDNGIVDYVEENIGHNGLEKFTYKNGVVYEGGYGLANMGLSEIDMNFCN